MNVLVILVIVGVSLLIAGAVLCYYNHPAVRLKRQIKQSLEREKQALQVLDDGFRQAKADMEQVARDWKQP